MAEWPNAAVLKTVVPKGAVGSNPLSSAIVNQAVSANVCGGKTGVPSYGFAPSNDGANPSLSAIFAIS